MFCVYIVVILLVAIPGTFSNFSTTKINIILATCLHNVIKNYGKIKSPEYRRKRERLYANNTYLEKTTSLCYDVKKYKLCMFKSYSGRQAYHGHLSEEREFRHLLQRQNDNSSYHKCYGEKPNGDARIEFDGAVLGKYPPALGAVFKIYKADATGVSISD